MGRFAVLGTFFAFVLTACGGWPSSPVVYNVPTPLPSRTPSSQPATPQIVSPSPSASATASPTGTQPTLETPATASLTPETPTPTVTPTPTATATLTATPPASTIKAKILGCEPSIDIVHGMGEVTNAYVTIVNPTSADLPNLCATLSALDEGEPYPDKTKCVGSLPSGYQVTFKLTVDTTFNKQTPIQIDIASDGNLLLRIGQASCSDIILVLPTVTELGVPMPIP